MSLKLSWEDNECKPLAEGIRQMYSRQELAFDNSHASTFRPYVQVFLWERERETERDARFHG
jgi:hypothetical protein